jgi:hypothetical protein
MRRVSPLRMETGFERFLEAQEERHALRREIRIHRY